MSTLTWRWSPLDLEHQLFDDDDKTGIHVALAGGALLDWGWFITGDWTGSLYPRLDEVQKVAADYYLKAKGDQ
jgi:hypothetical protein